MDAITENDIAISKRLGNYHQIMTQEGKAPEDQLKVLPNKYQMIQTEEELRARLGLSKHIKYI